MPANSAAVAFDRDHVWHPYSAARPGGANRLVVSARGARLRLADGTELVDAMSSWWAVIHGHRHPALDAAAVRQLGRMSHVMFGGLTHEPAVDVARGLLRIADPALRHVFLADSGSSAVEVAVKTCLQYWQGRGEPRRRRFLAVRGGFHGDTFAAMSVGDPEIGMHDVFAGSLAPQLFAPLPPRGAGLPDDHPDVVAWAAATAAVAERHAGELAGIVAEPVLQSARRMDVHPPGCVRALRRIADELDVPLVLDEVASGFGRLGATFAAELAGVAPDVLCLGKALTGGYLSLAAVLSTERIAEGVDASPPGALLHGPTYTANPLACAVAAANLELLAGGGWRDDVARLERGLRAGLAPLDGHPAVHHVTVLGGFAAVHCRAPLDPAAATEAAAAHGAWLRPFRHVVYVMPPYATTGADLVVVVRAVAAAVEAGTARGGAGPARRKSSSAAHEPPAATW